jgi:hypothetical protein
MEVLLLLLDELDDLLAVVLHRLSDFAPPGPPTPF